MGRGKKASWKLFEEAVARFAAAMDPTATVRPDLRTPDSDSGRRRQRDVWIEARVCNLYPVTVHVSCKLYRRRLHQGDIDTFVGELDSSRAHVGVIYSGSGFTGGALEKAKAKGIHCCRLYANEVTTLPESIHFTFYCTGTQVGLGLSPFQNWPLWTWNDLLDVRVTGESGQAACLANLIEAEFHRAEKEAANESARTGAFPHDFEANIVVPGGEGRSDLRVTALGHWRFYRANMDAYLVNGSYCLTAAEFRGQFATPAVDLQSTHPGAGWTEIEEIPTKIDLGGVMVRMGGLVEKVLREGIGKNPIA
jgi:hypothetical protein